MRIKSLSSYCLLGLLLLYGCGNAEKASAPSSSSHPTTFPLHAAPSFESPAVAELNHNFSFELITDSPNAFSSVEWQGRSYCKPWIKVTTDGSSGWLFCHPRLFESTNVEFITELEEAFLEALVSSDTFEQYQQWRRQKNNTASSILLAYRLSRSIKQEITAKTDNLHNDGCSISITWLSDFIPSFFIQSTTEKEHALIFTDYKYWLEKAALTEANIDDRFFSFCCQIYPQDSIEYTFPAWIFPTDKGKTYSLLGKNIHAKLLSEAEALSKDDSFLKVDLTNISSQIVKNITNEKTEFWESEAVILAELEAICAKNWTLLQPYELVLLHKRLEQFQQKKLDGVVVNARLGLSD